VRPCFYPSSQGDSAEVSLRVLENRPDLGRTYRLGRTIQCSRRACVPRAKLRSALGYLIVPLWGGRIRWTRTISVITQQATEVLRLQLRPRCKLQKSCGRAQERVIHQIPARKGAECELDVACRQCAEDGSRCRDALRERPNAHAPRDGQDRGVVPRSVDGSASARRCESTASKSDAIRPIQPSCKQHGVGYVRSSAKANGTSEDPCSQSHTHGSLGLRGQSPLHMGDVRLWRIACHHTAGSAGQQAAASI